MHWGYVKFVAHNLNNSYRRHVYNFRVFNKTSYKTTYMYNNIFSPYHSLCRPSVNVSKHIAKACHVTI